MHFFDLTNYTYFPEKSGPPTLNIGWLDSAVPFEKGEVPSGFVDRLKELIQHRYHSSWGYHVCQFCDGLAAAASTGWKGNPALHDECHADGRFSSAEIRVQGNDGRGYASPRMIAHYVEAHGYKPPEEFIRAVMQETKNS